MPVNIYPASDISNGTPKSLVHFQRVSSLLSGNGLSLVAQTITRCQAWSQHTLKSKGELSCFKLSNLFQMVQVGAGLVGVPEPHNAGHRLLLGSVGADERHPSAWREMPPMPVNPFAEHPQEMRQICGKAGVSAEMLPSTPTHPPPIALLVSLLGCCSCPCCREWIWAGEAAAGGWGWNRACFFENLDLLPWQPKQAVSPPQHLALGLNWVPLRETWGDSEWPQSSVLEVMGSRNHIISRL